VEDGAAERVVVGLDDEALLETDAQRGLEMPTVLNRNTQDGHRAARRRATRRRQAIWLDRRTDAGSDSADGAAAARTGQPDEWLR
jgi:hypothetical protein